MGLDYYWTINKDIQIVPHHDEVLRSGLSTTLSQRYPQKKYAIIAGIIYQNDAPAAQVETDRELSG